MRTTVDINDAILNELREISRKNKRSFKVVMEETLQYGLAQQRLPSSPKAIRISPSPIGIRKPWRNLSMNQLYDQLEAESTLPDS